MPHNVGELLLGVDLSLSPWTEVWSTPDGRRLMTIAPAIAQTLASSLQRMLT
jgi:hypothetical protein